MHSQVVMLGEPHAPPLLLIHGARFSRALWQPQAGFFARQYRVLMPDLPGHGTQAAQRFSLDLALQQLVALIERQPGGRAAVVGISAGGYVALALASQRPDLVPGVVLASCSALLEGASAAMIKPFLLMTRLLATFGHRFMEQAELRTLRQRYSAAIIGPTLATGLFYRAMPDVSAAAALDFRRMLRRYPGPMLVLNGEQDRVFRRHEHDFVTEAQHARLQVIPAANHLSNLDQPEQFNAAVAGFLQEIGWQP